MTIFFKWLFKCKSSKRGKSAFFTHCSWVHCRTWRQKRLPLLNFTSLLASLAFQKLDLELQHQLIWLRTLWRPQLLGRGADDIKLLALVNPRLRWVGLYYKSECIAMSCQWPPPHQMNVYHMLLQILKYMYSYLYSYIKKQTTQRHCKQH